MYKEIINSEIIKTLPTRDLIKIFGGFIEGHITFETGEHGDGYTDNLQFLRFPQVMEEIGRRLALQFYDQKEETEVIVGPSIIGAIIAYSVAKNFQVPFTTTYRQYGSGEMTFHRGFIPPNGSKCLFVDDFVFNGRCLTDNVLFMKENGLVVVGASVIGMRQNSLVLDVPIRSLITIDFLKTPSEECQLCKNNIPITATNIRE